MTMTSPVTTVLRAVPTGLFIGGQWRPAQSGNTLDVEDPATGAVRACVADGDATDAAAALQAADTAQAGFAATSPRERSDVLYRAYQAVLAQKSDIAALITMEMGKPLAEAEGEVDYGADFLRWFAEEAVRVRGDATVSADGRTRMMLTRGPVGPCVLITPWNFPLAMAARKIAPAIAAGCTMVFKPAEQTPLTALLLTKIFHDAGLPPGVLNVVTTARPADVVEPWLRSTVTRKVSFTGSTAVGKMLLKQAAGTVMRTSMELGGNAALIVCADADLNTAVEGTLIAKMRNIGQACTAANRLYVHRSLAEPFVGELIRRMSRLQPGPLIDERARAKAQRLVDDAVIKGAQIRLGGAIPDGPGYFYPPTVLTEVPADARLLTEEIFAPIAPIVVFDDDREAIGLANATPSGLTGYVFSENLDRALAVGDALETGMVGINTGVVSNPAAPFGGIKESGLGREGSHLGLGEYLTYKYTAIPRRKAHV